MIGLCQTYLNWRIERTRSALAEMERGFYESSEKLQKEIERADECVIYQWDSDTLRYLRRMVELKEKEGKLVEKLSSAGTD